jgi:hypothetical protein
MTTSKELRPKRNTCICLFPVFRGHPGIRLLEYHVAFYATKLARCKRSGVGYNRSTLAASGDSEREDQACLEAAAIRPNKEGNECARSFPSPEL